MSFFAPVRVRVEKDIVVRLKRFLKGSGVIKVKIGQEVVPADIIGTSNTSPGFRTLNLSTLLSVSPKEVEKYLTKKLGQRIYKDELLAYKKEWFFGRQKVVTAPTDGVLDFLNPQTGELKMSFLPKKVDLPAGVFGIVEKVDAQKGWIIIRTQVSRIHGMFGSGKPRDGILHILSSRDDLIIKPMISAKFDDHILVGGSLFFKDAISSAISAGVNGIVTGGINAKDYKSIAGGRLIFPKKLDTDIGISIVICEGFGTIPIGEDIFKILLDYEDKFVSIDGNGGLINLPSYFSNSIIRVRNTNLPPIQDENSVLDAAYESDVCELKVGFKLRIIGNQYAGNIGKLVAIDQTETLMSSGIRAHLATIEGSRRKIQVPVANCEVIL